MEIPSNIQQLIFEGRNLKEGSFLQDYNIMKYDNIYLVSSLCGGIGCFNSPSSSWPCYFKSVRKLENLVALVSNASTGAVVSRSKELSCSTFIVENFKDPHVYA